MKVLALAIGLAAVTTQVFAGWSCTMPNGAIVFRQLSECPADAVHAEQRDSALPNPVKTFKHAPQETLTVGPALPDPPRRAQTPPPVPQSPAAAPPAPPRDLISEANAVCVLLRLKGATTCELEVNIFSASYIDATMPTSAAAAKWVCLGIANQTRQAGSPFVGRGWQLKIFSPYGDGSRPVAVCAL